MKGDVISLNTADFGGGAENLSKTIHEGLMARHWNSRLLVGQKHGSDPNIFPIHSSPHFDYRTTAELPQVKFQKAILFRDKILGRESFHYPFSRWLTSIAGFTQPRAVIAHNLHGGYFDLRVIPEITASIPVFWFLHDFWALTGHCAFPLDCDRWKTSCGSCPHLKIPPAINWDNTRNNLKKKKGIYGRSKLHIVVPCQWLADQVEHSILGQNRFQVSIIPYGIDLDRFSPAPEVSGSFGDIEKSELLGVFIANRPEINPFKNFPLLISMMQELDAQLCSSHSQIPRLRFIAVGALEGQKIFEGKRVILETIPYTSQSGIVELLRLADFYLHPTRNEITPLAIYEAMACGLPVITSNIGGIGEMLEHDVEGLIVSQATAKNWIPAIIRLAESNDLRHRMGIAARARMLKLGGTQRMLDQIEALLNNSL